MRVFIFLLFLGCASEDPEESVKPIKGACEYSWYSSGWTTWCYQDFTESSCLAFQVSTYQSLKLFNLDKTCAQMGYNVKCSTYWKKSTCLWYE